MKKLGYIIACALFSTSLAFAQGEMDAYRYSRSELSGSARSVAMGGAFGALGGDISVLHINPAGLGVYQTSEVVTTVNFMHNKMTSDMKGNSITDKLFTFSLDNIGAVLSFDGGNGGRLNFGFSFNKDFSYNNRYNISGQNMGSSLTQYIAESTNRFNGGNGIAEDDLTMADNYYDPFDYGLPWLSILGYNAYLMDPVSTDRPTDPVHYTPIFSSGTATNNNMYVDEKGSVSTYNFSLGGSAINDRLYLGATFALTDMDYYMNSIYQESSGGTGHYVLDNYLLTRGLGFNMKLGLIVRPINAIRVGVAFHSPTWYQLTDEYEFGITSLKDRPYGMDDYSFRTPEKWVFSVAGILGRSAIVSADWEIANYRRMNLGYYGAAEANSYINEDFRVSHIIRVGAEAKMTNRFSLRAGAEFRTSAIDTDVRTNIADGKLEIRTVGTTPQFMIDRGSNTYTFGLGYRFTQKFYMDLACAMMRYTADYYNFSALPASSGSETYVASEKGTIKTNRTKALVTLGYKF